MEIAIGVVLLVLGAAGASATTRTFEERGGGRLAVLGNAPMGILIGGGAALIRGWDVGGSMVAGAILLPLIALGMRVAASRRTRRPGDADRILADDGPGA